MKAASHLYLIALGSNQCHPTIGRPRDILRHAIDALELPDIDVFDASSIMTSRPLGPAQRDFANAAALLVSHLNPPQLMQELRHIEAHFGRQRRGQQWRPRILDLDIILWDGGCWVDDAVTLPHPAFRQRGFVLRPAAQIAPQMRDPLTGLTIQQLAFRLSREKASRGNRKQPQGRNF